MRTLQYNTPYLKNTVHCFLCLFLLQAPVDQARASDDDKKRSFQVGTHSMVAIDDVELSRINPDFDDLFPSGLDGPHHSSVHLLISVNRHFRIGAETLAGNSSSDENTSLNFQGIGLLAELTYGGRFFVNGGLHAGGVIVNATTRIGESDSSSTHRGKFYKDTGVFVAPYVGVGYRRGNIEFSLMAKWLEFLEGEDDEFSSFSAPYAGLGIGLNF